MNTLQTTYTDFFHKNSFYTKHKTHKGQRQKLHRDHTQVHVKQCLPLSFLFCKLAQKLFGLEFAKLAERCKSKIPNLLR